MKNYFLERQLGMGADRRVVLKAPAIRWQSRRSRGVRVIL